MAPSVIVAPSILSSDFARLAEEAKFMKEYGADWLHVDCMDGHFVPNLTIGAPTVKSLSKHTDMYLDCHLMVTNPGQWVEDFAKAGANGITFHIESFIDQKKFPYDKDSPSDYSYTLSEKERQPVVNLCNQIHRLGMRAGIALRPKTTIDTIQFLLDTENLVDMVLIMTVEPGFGGQKFMTHVMPKVSKTRQLYPELNIEVDGGIAPSTVDTVIDAGANVLVSGSAVFGSDDPKGVIERLRNGGKSS